MRYGYVVHDNDMGMQDQALERAGCDQVHYGDLSNVLSKLVADDVLVVWRADKLANTFEGLEQVFDEVHQAGATVELVYEQIRSSRDYKVQLSQLIDIMKQL